VTKLDAARRQLRAAILLWFLEEDPVSIHTLASAAHEITHTLFKREGLEGLLFDSPIVRYEARSDVPKKLKAAATFFKHAQRDPDETHEFNPSINPLLFVAVGNGLARMGEELGDVETAFYTWFGIFNPHLLTEDVYEKFFTVNQLEEIKSLKRTQFLEYFLKMKASLAL
jgi:hypothetical protein